MEPILAENAAAEDRGTMSPLGLSALDVLVGAWARAEASVPTAIVHSIFDDVLSALDEAPFAGPTMRFRDVLIDARGVASLDRDANASISGVALLFARALGDDPPPQAHALIARISDEPARDAETLRSWLREVFGSPAPHDEVSSALYALEAPPSDPPVLGAADAVLDFVADERDQPTEIMRTRSVPPPQFEVPILSAIPEPVQEETALPEPVPSDRPPPQAEPAAPREAQPPVAEQTPVIRHQLPKPSVRVHSAPAARRSAKAVADPRDSLLIPEDRPHWGAWIFVVLLIGIGLLFWLRYL